MKRLKIFTSILFGLLTAALIALPVANYLELDPAPVAAGLFALPFAIKLCVNAYYGFMPRQATGVAFMAVQKENWVDYILGNIFKNNEFLSKCYREDDAVLNGTVVHIPQAGAKPVVRKNRSLLPGVAVQRTDTDVTYPLDWYTTDPTVITNAEQKEVSYEKMGSVIGEHVDTMGDTIADDVLYKWAPTVAGYILRTLGAVADNVALANGATGNRKPLTAKSLRQAQAKMNNDGVARDGRVAVIPEDMMTQLMEDTTLTGSQIQLLLDAKEGKVAKLFSFEILTRSHAGIYDNTGTPVPKAPETASATTDNLAVLCFQKNAVALATGTTDFFENKQDALFYGDVYSAGQRAGARKRYADGRGVIAIVQTT
jgi:hypothetical protein